MTDEEILMRWAKENPAGFVVVGDALTLIRIARDAQTEALAKIGSHEVAALRRVLEEADHAATQWLAEVRDDNDAWSGQVPVGLAQLRDALKAYHDNWEDL